MILSDVGDMESSKLSLKAAVAKKVVSAVIESRLRGGRHTVEIVNIGAEPVYLGNKNVTVNDGVPIKAGASKIIPVNNNAIENLAIVSAVDTAVIIAEYMS